MQLSTLELLIFNILIEDYAIKYNENKLISLKASTLFESIEEQIIRIIGVHMTKITQTSIISRSNNKSSH